MSTSIENRLRFAPSPNGYLHLGHAYSALLNWSLADHVSGQCLLRIEDIDQSRFRPEYELAIFDDLNWLGLQWSQPVMRQSDRFDAYQLVLDRLIKEELVYPAFLSRRDIMQKVSDIEASGHVWPKDPDGAPIYPGECRTLSIKERQSRIDRGDAFNWRLDMNTAVARTKDASDQDLSWTELDMPQLSIDAPDQPLAETIIKADPVQWGDVVLARRDVPTSYHLSVVLDDAMQDVNLIVRGADLYASTSVHRVLQRLLQLPAPRYIHHKLIRDKNGRKLSKSDRDTTLQQLRKTKGLTVQDVKKLIGFG
jgi:glutamyl-Q tRNA(Asp) synthetase